MSCASINPIETTRWICSTPEVLSEGRGRTLRRHLLGIAGELPPDRGGDRRSGEYARRRSCALTEPPQPHGRLAGDGAGVSCSRTPGRRACSRRASGCRASSSRSPSSRSPRPARDYPRGSWILQAQPGLDSRARGHGRRAWVSTFQRARHAAPHVAHARGARAAALHLGALGRHGHHRLGALRARSAPRSLRLRARRGHPRAANLRARCDVLLYGHVDLELAEQIEGIPKAWGPDAFQENRGDPESRHAGRLGRHHRRHRLCRPRRDPAIRGGRRPPRHARQRLHAAARGQGWYAACGANRAAYPAAPPAAAADAAGASQFTETRTPGSAFEGDLRSARTSRSPTGTPAHTLRVPRKLRAVCACHGAGCAWRIARLASMAPSTRAAW